MITHSSGSLKAASDLANEASADSLESVGNDLGIGSAGFAGGGLPPNNPNDTKNNPIQRSSQTLHKVSQSAQRQKVVQAVQRRYGNSIAARLVANYTNAANSGNSKPKAGGPATRPQITAAQPVLTRVHISTRPGVINRACCKQCEEQEQIQRTFEPNQPVITTSQTVVEAELAPIIFPAKPEALETGEIAAQTTTDKPATTELSKQTKKALAPNGQAKKRAKANEPQVAAETETPEQATTKIEVVGNAGGTTSAPQSQDQVPAPTEGPQLFAATFKQARQAAAPLQQEENLKWQKALSAHPQLADSAKKSLRIQPAVAHPAPANSKQALQLDNPVIEQNKNVAEKALQSSKTMLGQLGAAGAFFMPDRKEFVNNSLTDAIPDGLPVMRTPQPGVNTSLEMEKIAQKEQQRRQLVEAMVSQFLAANSGKGQEILNVACEIPAQISSAANAAKGQLAGALGQTLGAISQQFENAKSQVTAQSQNALQAISQQHTQALSKIQASTAKAAQYLVTARKAAATELQAKIAKEEKVFNQTYAKWQPKYKEEGNKVGQEAEKIAENKAKQYESQKINRNDNFFDGPLTDNRMDARAKAARQVGESYSKSMQEEGAKQAAKMMEGKAKDVENLKKEVGADVSKSLDECVTKTKEDIKKAEAEIIKSAQEAQTKLIEAVNANTAKIHDQLAQGQASTTEQAHKIADQLNQQIDQTANGSIKSISQSANTAAQKVNETLAQFSQSLRGSTAPDEAAMSAALAQAGGQINSMVAEITGKLMQSSGEVSQGLGKLAQQGATSLKGVEQQATEQAHALLESMQGFVTELISSATESYGEITKTHEENATKQSEFIKKQYKEIFKALDECFAKVNTQMEQGFGKSVQEFGQALRDYMNGGSPDALIQLIEKNAEEAADKVEPRWLGVLKIVVAVVVSIVIAVVLGPAVIGAIGAFAGALGASAAVAGAIGAIVGGAIVGAIGGALSQLANNVISNLAGIKTNLLDGVLESFISGAVGGALGGAGGLLVKAGDSFLKSFAVEVGSDILGGLVGDNVANLALGKPLEFNLSPMDVALSVLTTGLTNDKIMNKIPGLESFQNKGMEAGQNFGTKVGNSFKPDFKVSTPDGSIKTPDIKTPEVNGVATKDAGIVNTKGIGDKGLDVPNIGSSKTPDIKTPDIKDVGKTAPVDNSAKTGDTKSTPQADNSAGGSKKGKTKEYLHGDVPEIENFVVAKLPTSDGHNIKVLKDGRIARCSTCGVITAVYGVELTMAPNLKAALEAAKVETDVNAKVATAQKIEAQLRTIQDVKLLLQKKGAPAANINNLIGKLDGGNPQHITAIMDFVGRHGLLNAANSLTFNSLHIPPNPVTAVSTADGAYTALGNELKIRPNGEPPSGTPAADPPVKDFGDTLLKIKTEALEALQKRMVRSGLRKLPLKDWMKTLSRLDNTLKDANNKTELENALERLGLENGMPGMIQLQARAEILLKSMIDVEKPDGKQLINLGSYFTANDVDLALTKQIGDKLDNIDPASYAGKDLIKKIKKDFYKNNLVGVTNNAIGFRKLIRKLGLWSSSFNAKYKQDKLRLRNEVTAIFNKALDSEQVHPLTTEDKEFLQLSGTDKEQLDTAKDTVHSNLQKLSVALNPLLAQAGSKAKVDGFFRIPIFSTTGSDMAFIGMRIALSGEHDVYFFENKPADDFDKTREENAQAKKELRDEMSEQLGPAGRIVSKVGDGLGKKPEPYYKLRAEIAITGGYQAVDPLSKKFKKLVEAGAEGGFYIEAESNVNIERSLELISFGIQRRLLEHKGIIPGPWIADMVWGKAEPSATPPPANGSPSDTATDGVESKPKNARKWNEDFMKSLTNDEYVESGGFGNAFGGVAFGGDKKKLKLKGNFKLNAAKRYHKNTMQAIKDTKGITDLALTGRQQKLGRKIRTAEVGVEFGVSKFAFGGKFKMAMMPSQITPTQLKAVNERIPDVKAELDTAKTDLDTAKTAYEANPADAALKLDFDDKTTAYNDKKNEYHNLILQQKLLPEHLFELGGEVSAASKGGEWFGDPTATPAENHAALAAAIMNAVGNFATQFKGFVTHNKSQYAKDRGNDHLYSSALTSLPFAIDERVLNRMKEEATKKKDSILDSAGGFKISLRIGAKQDFALAGNSGLWYEPGIGTAQLKFDLSIDQIGQLGFDSAVGGGSIEKSSLLLRISFRYRQGNWLLVEDSIMNRVMPTFTRPRATAKNQLPAPVPTPAPVETPGTPTHERGRSNSAPLIHTPPAPKRSNSAPPTLHGETPTPTTSDLGNNSAPPSPTSESGTTMPELHGETLGTTTPEPVNNSGQSSSTNESNTTADADANPNTNSGTDDQQQPATPPSTPMPEPDSSNSVPAEQSVETPNTPDTIVPGNNSGQSSPTNENGTTADADVPPVITAPNPAPSGDEEVVPQNPAHDEDTTPQNPAHDEDATPQNTTRDENATPQDTTHVPNPSSSSNSTNRQQPGMTLGKTRPKRGRSKAKQPGMTLTPPTHARKRKRTNSAPPIHTPPAPKRFKSAPQPVVTAIVPEENRSNTHSSTDGSGTPTAVNPNTNSGTDDQRPAVPPIHTPHALHGGTLDTPTHVRGRSNSAPQPAVTGILPEEENANNIPLPSSLNNGSGITNSQQPTVPITNSVANNTNPTEDTEN